MKFATKISPHLRRREEPKHRRSPSQLKNDQQPHVLQYKCTNVIVYKSLQNLDNCLKIRLFRSKNKSYPSFQTPTSQTQDLNPLLLFTDRSLDRQVNTRNQSAKHSMKPLSIMHYELTSDTL